MDNFKDYVQSIYRRVQIATAVHVINQTPVGKTPEIYATDLQTRLKLQWYRTPSYNDESNSTRKLWQEHLDSRILTEHQHALSSCLHGIIPNGETKQPPEYEDFSDFSEWSDDDDEVYKNIIDSDEKENAPSEDNRFQDNIDFIRSVIHLNTLCNMYVTVPMSKVNHLVSKLPISKDLSTGCSKVDSVDDGFFSNSTAFEETDSGLLPSIKGKSRSRKCGVAGISSGVLQYVLRSCDGEQLVDKSVQAILNQLSKFACEIHTSKHIHNFIQVSTSWMGSVYQHAVSVLHEVVETSSTIGGKDASSSQQACLTLINKILDSVLQEQSKQNLVREVQCLFLLELCRCSSLCSKTLQLAMDKIENLSAVREKKSTGRHFSAFHNMEWDFSQETQASEDFPNRSEGSIELNECTVYLFVFTVRLIRQYLNFFNTAVDGRKGENMKKKNRQVLQNTHSIAELWRTYHLDPQDAENKKKKEIFENWVHAASTDVDGWLNILESSSLSFMEDCPLATFYFWECKNLLLNSLLGNTRENFSHILDVI